MKRHQTLMHMGKTIRENLLEVLESGRERPGQLRAPICATALTPGNRRRCTLSNNGIRRGVAKRVEAAAEGSAICRGSFQDLLAGVTRGQGEWRRQFPCSAFWLSILVLSSSLSFSVSFLSLILSTLALFSLKIFTCTKQRPEFWRTSSKMRQSSPLVMLERTDSSSKGKSNHHRAQGWGRTWADRLVETGCPSI